MLRLQWLKNSRPQLAHTNPAKKSLMVPPSQLYTQWLNWHEKRLCNPAAVRLKVHDCMMWSGAMQTKFTSAQPKKCSGGCVTVEEQWHLVPVPRRALLASCWGHCTSGHQGPLLQHTTTAPRNSPPWHPACLRIQGEKQRNGTLCRCKDPQESGAAKERQADRKASLGTQQLTDPHLSTV